MARARNIKPGFFKNEVLAEQPIFVRLLFVGLWTLADREGRIEDRPKRIKLELFPYDSESVEDGLSALTASGFVTRYAASGKSVIQIVNFLKHQTPHGTEKDSELPDESGALTVHERGSNGYVTGSKRANNVNSQTNNVVPLLSNSAATVNPLLLNTLNPESRIMNPDLLNNPVADATDNRFSEVVGVGSAKKATRLPKDWEPSPELVNWATAERPDLDLKVATESFVDFWVAKAGKDGAKLDWVATYRNWIRNQRFNTRGGPSAGSAFAGAL